MSSEVPPYPIATTRGTEQQRFYQSWLRAWKKGQTADVENEYGYLFDYIRDLISSAQGETGVRKIESEMLALRKAYPFTKRRGSASFHFYTIEYTADAQVILGQYDKAIETLSTAYDLLISAEANKILGLKLFIGRDASGMDMLFLRGVPRLTDWGRTNLAAISKSADMYLEEKRRELKSDVLPSWVEASKAIPLPYPPPMTTYTPFPNCTSQFQTSIPYYYFHSFIRPFSVSVPDIVRQVENLAREQQGLPRIGEGWTSEVELLHQIRDAFPILAVEHHSSPAWLGRQHLDIYIPGMRVALEFQGEQHDEPIDYFGGEEAFRETQRRDARKLELCRQNGICLIYVRPGYSIEDVIKQIQGASQKTGANTA